MCGIAGIWRFSDRIADCDRSDVERMIDVIGHRGPDGRGCWHDSHLVLGHNRLAILDLTSRGQQPAVTPSGDAVLVYNGEVYNHRELRVHLENAGIRFRGESDTEVVLHALDYWGVEDAVRRFSGMFAFAFYDTRAKSLWLCRDRLGIKALSFASVGDRFLFASEDKAVLASSCMETRVNARAITLLLAGQRIDAQISSFEGIERLPPAACWRIDRDGISKSSYWSALTAIDLDRLANTNFDDAPRKAQLEALLRDSVSLHGMADVDLATACSSGVDSGLVTAFAGEKIQGLNAYVATPDMGDTEVQGARATSAKVGVRLREVSINRQNYLRCLPEAIYHIENGNPSASTPALLTMTKQCRDDGVKVLLTGEGSDELLGGYPWYAESAKQAAAVQRKAAFAFNQKTRDRRIQRFLAAPFANNHVPGGQDARDLFAVSLSARQGLFHEEILETLSSITPLSTRAYAANGIYDLYTHMASILHRHDRISMAASVELRVPFLENGLIDFALNLNPHFKYRNRQGKWLLKEVATKYLPAENIRAKKKGFPVTHEYLDGTETILESGFLSQIMGWTTLENKRIVELCKSNGTVRRRLVSHEIFAQLFIGGKEPGEIGDDLIMYVASRAAA